MNQELLNFGEVIIEQLGGNKFIAMTGTKDFIIDNATNTLSMRLQKNQSGANRLYINLQYNDLYEMKFVKFTSARFDKKTFEVKEAKSEYIKIYINVYAEDLQRIFKEVTGFDTNL